MDGKSFDLLARVVSARRSRRAALTALLAAALPRPAAACVPTDPCAMPAMAGPPAANQPWEKKCGLYTGNCGQVVDCGGCPQEQVSVTCGRITCTVSPELAALGIHGICAPTSPLPSGTPCRNDWGTSVCDGAGVCL